MIEKSDKWRCDLLEAANIIEERGWCKRAFFECDGSVCLEGAIMTAVGLAPTLGTGRTNISKRIKNKRYLAAESALWTHLGVRPSRYNDNTLKSKEEAVTVLRKAATKGL